MRDTRQDYIDYIEPPSDLRRCRSKLRVSSPEPTRSAASIADSKRGTLSEHDQGLRRARRQAAHLDLDLELDS